jgi:hypothetical protein
MANIDDLTYGEMKQIAALFKAASDPFLQERCLVQQREAIPVIVCTDKRGVVFGYTTAQDSRPITLTEARMCLYWSADVGGVFGLGEKGPTSGCKISATLSSLTLEGVTAVFSVDATAEEAWKSARVQGR